MNHFNRCLLRTAADAAGLPDGPMGDISKEVYTRCQEVDLARNLAVCLLTFSGVKDFEIHQYIPNHKGFKRMAERSRPPVQLLVSMQEYADKMLRDEISDEEVELLQIQTEQWFDMMRLR